MRVPFCETKRLYLEQKAEIDAAVAGVLSGGHYVLGENVRLFEEEMEGEMRDGRGPDGFVVSCNSGTDALILSLLALGCGPGDEVITPSHTAIPTIAAIRAAGATPVFADIDPETWLLAPAEIPRLRTSRTRAVFSPHLYGNMVDMKALQATAGDLPLVEDAAQAQGARLGGASAGTLGRFGAFSFYPTKNIGAIGDGGAIRCRAPEDAESLRMLRYYGQKDRYHAERDRGVNSRLDELQAAILRLKLRKLGEWGARKKRQVERYRRELAGLPLRFQKTTPGCEPAWHLFVVAVESESVRDRLIAALREKNGIDTLVHYPRPTHLQPAFMKDGARGSLPVTEALTPRIVSLPMYACLTDEEQDAVIAALRGFFG